jgi:magnesium chelatase family protein
MMLSTIFSAAIYGVSAYLVEIEIDLSYGLPGVTVVGLPDAAVQESKERVRSAIRNAGLKFPALKATVNLAPASQRKTGPIFDLPIALGILQASEQLPAEPLSEWVIIGELSLNGNLKPAQGVLALAMAAAQAGKRCLLVPRANASEAALVHDLQVYAAENLVEAVAILTGTDPTPAVSGPALFQSEQTETHGPDYADVKGQVFAKRGLEIAAAGGHNLLMIGPPGTGKTMLAQRLPGILPAMDFQEALEATKIYSICGNLRTGQSGLLRQRPFRAPHHAISVPGLVGGCRFPRPGEISLAHHGVLFLDELPEFRREVLEVLRQPLEEGSVTLARAQASITYPARFMLVGAMNPCPCGFYGDSRRVCQCSPAQLERYRNRLSGPLLDRIDLHVEVLRLSESEMMSLQPAESSQAIRQRVQQARQRQKARFLERQLTCNADMQSHDLRVFCLLKPTARQLLHQALEKMNLSARAYDRIVKVARTLADLANTEQIEPEHIAEAIQFRALDRGRHSLTRAV